MAESDAEIGAHLNFGLTRVIASIIPAYRLIFPLHIRALTLQYTIVMHTAFRQVILLPCTNLFLRNPSQLLPLHEIPRTINHGRLPFNRRKNYRSLPLLPQRIQLHFLRVHRQTLKHTIVKLLHLWDEVYRLLSLSFLHRNFFLTAL